MISYEIFLIFLNPHNLQPTQKIFINLFLTTASDDITLMQSDDTTSDVLIIVAKRQRTTHFNFRQLFLRLRHVRSPVVLPILLPVLMEIQFAGNSRVYDVD